MEDFDIFSDEITYTKSLYIDLLKKYTNDVHATPNASNYQSGKKLLAEECLKAQKDLECAFHLSEAVAANLRTMAVYRDKQIKIAGNKLNKITDYIKPVSELADKYPVAKNHEEILAAIQVDTQDITETLSRFSVEDEQPFYKKYLGLGPHNNVDNLKNILKDIPKEWTVVQLTAPYNPNENLKLLAEYRTDIESIYVSMFTNDYYDGNDDPITVNVPANVTKEGELPLFKELHSLIEENYNTIDNAHFLNTKHFVRNYWYKREEIDLRMKSVILLMEKDWLGAWGCLLTGKLVDRALRDRVVELVEDTITDWGFFKLTKKQRILLYNLIESSPNLSSVQIKPCIRKILTEHGNIEDLRQNLEACKNCTKDFVLPNELCVKCLSKSFLKLHNFTLVDGIRAFSSAVRTVKDDEQWACLKKAKRYPVLLIVDEILDTFPWETLPILNHHPVCRMENIHFLYYLYKTHESRIKDGYFMTQTDVCRYVINPEKNLDRMEKRMKSFVEYWCGSWKGHVGQPPSPDDYLQYLVYSDIFLYCGHGDGCRLGAGGADGVGVEGARGTRALCLLSGCGSVRLAIHAPRAPPAASHHHLHIAGCPSVVGMLWEVTDLEVDKVVSTLVALSVPSRAPRPWHAVGKAAWSRGALDTTVEPKETKSQVEPERDLLMAISRARGSTNFVMIASTVVARGLPIRVEDPTMS